MGKNTKIISCILLTLLVILTCCCISGIGFFIFSQEEISTPIDSIIWTEEVAFEDRYDKIRNPEKPDSKEYDVFLERFDEHFRVKYMDTKRPSEKYVKDLKVALEKSYDELQDDFDVRPDKINIEIYTDRKVFASKINIYDGGFALRGIAVDPENIYVLIDEEVNYAITYEDIKYLSTHELAHNFLMQEYYFVPQKFNILPYWYLEGMAEVMALEDADSDTRFVIADGIMTKAGTLESLEKLIRSTTSSDEQAMGYAGAHVFYEFLVGEYGSETIKQVKDNMSSTMPEFKTGFKDATGDDLDKVYAGWLKGLKEE